MHKRISELIFLKVYYKKILIVKWTAPNDKLYKKIYLELRLLI